ncbi:PfkB family carbohydrate kinase [Paraburkholderia sp.]|uniref:PfkB family carbohydrate kinase n=1 Tax=Paraburkholderia sp. TaxID=1926495 RepID=UPI002F3FC0B5
MSTATGLMPRICVVGNAAIDLSLSVARLPSPGETTLALDSTSGFGGKGANQAVAAARAGASTLLFAAVGDDADGDRLVAQLNAEGIDTRHMQRMPCPTDLSIVTVDAAGENTIVTRNLAAANYRPERCALQEATRDGDWIALQGNLSAEVTAEVLRIARLGAGRTLLNPGPVRFDCLSMLSDVDVLVVNRVEAATLTAMADAARAAAALHRAGAREVCVTLGADGVLRCDRHGTQHLAAVPAEAVDTVGAGDAFCGTLLAALARNLPMPHALRWAQAVAAFAVARPGAQASFPDRATMHALLHAAVPQSVLSSVPYSQAR